MAPLETPSVVREEDEEAWLSCSANTAAALLADFFKVGGFMVPWETPSVVREKDKEAWVSCSASTAAALLGALLFLSCLFFLVSFFFDEAEYLSPSDVVASISAGRIVPPLLVGEAGTRKAISVGPLSPILWLLNLLTACCALDRK